MTGLKRKTVQNIKYVADNVPSSLRREDLSYKHHEEVAKLEPKKTEGKFGALK